MGPRYFSSSIIYHGHASSIVFSSIPVLLYLSYSLLLSPLAPTTPATMYFSSPLVLVLALAPSTLFASPIAQRQLPSLSDFLSKRDIPTKTFKALTDGVCDLDGVTMPTGKFAPSPSPPGPH